MPLPTVPVFRPASVVFGWGANFCGQLGQEASGNLSTPVQLSRIGDFMAVAAGREHSVALRSDGTVWIWGERSQPRKIEGPGEIVVVAAGDRHALALRLDGHVWAWGDNSHGQLGDDTRNWSMIPVRVVGLRGARTIAAGSGHSLALADDGTVMAWGDNSSGQLGASPRSEASLHPSQVHGLREARAIAAGRGHSLALTSDGRVWAWGDNSRGQLGDGTRTWSASPVRVAGLSDVSAIAAGSDHSLALRSDGTVWAWGDNYWGQLGDSTPLDEQRDRTAPVQVGPVGMFTAIAAGSEHSLALRSDGTVWAWGGHLRTYPNLYQPGRVEDDFLDGSRQLHDPRSKTAGPASVDLRSVGALASGGGLWARPAALPSCELGPSRDPTPTRIRELTGVNAIAAGAGHSLALR